MSLSSLFATESRGVSEVVYVAIIAAAIIGIGGTGFIMASDITESSADRLEATEFELVEAESYTVEYTSSKTLTSSDVDTLWAVTDDGDRKELYDGELSVEKPGQYNKSIEEGDIVLDKDTALTEGDSSIRYGDSLDIVIETPEGDSYVVDQVRLPPAESLGDRTESNGTVILTDQSNIHNQTELETTNGTL
jgi:hypothetical protein